MPKNVPIRWYQLAQGFSISFATETRFISFGQNLHISMWARGSDIGPSVIDFRRTEAQTLVQVVTKYIESAASRVVDKFPQVGALHAVISNIRSTLPPLPILDERSSVAGFVDNEYTETGVALGYAEFEARPNFRYLNVRDLQIKLPPVVQVDSDPIPTRYERVPVI